MYVHCTSIDLESLPFLFIVISLHSLINRVIHHLFLHVHDLRLLLKLLELETFIRAFEMIIT